MAYLLTLYPWIALATGILAGYGYFAWGMFVAIGIVLIGVGILLAYSLGSLWAILVAVGMYIVGGFLIYLHFFPGLLGGMLGGVSY